MSNQWLNWLFKRNQSKGSDQKKSKAVLIRVRFDPHDHGTPDDDTSFWDRLFGKRQRARVKVNPKNKKK